MGLDRPEQKSELKHHEIHLSNHQRSLHHSSGLTRIFARRLRVWPKSIAISDCVSRDQCRSFENHSFFQRVTRQS